MPGSNLNRIQKEHKCRWCGVIFLRPSYRSRPAMFCSRSCVAFASQPPRAISKVGDQFVCRLCGATAIATQQVLSSGKAQCVTCKRAKKRSAQDRNRQKRLEWMRAHPGKETEYHATWARKYPHKARAHRLLHEAVRKGELVRKPCQECGAEKTHGHHHDYAKPLDVIWLCAKCHGKQHRKVA